MKQHTLGGEFVLKGKGLHTGAYVTLRLKPADINVGYIIRRVDLIGKSDSYEMKALAEYVSATERGTVLRHGDCQVSTVEHCLSALYALGIDNCIMEVDAPEFPILDGSASQYVTEIQRVGISEQMAERREYIVTSKTTYTMGESSITLMPDDKFSVQVMVGYDSPILANQYAILDSMQDYVENISSCRTFVFVREIEQLIQAGLIKGGDLNNALVIYDKKIPDECLHKICAACGQEPQSTYDMGYINGPLKFPNEPARHKLLDIIGDLALVGVHIRGRIVAIHPGHGINTSFATSFRKKVARQEVSTPVVECGAKPIYDINDIRRLLPHRYPMLLVDKIMEIGEQHVVAVKNVTCNEPFFQGHFPDELVMPGVLQIEAMAQAIGIMVLSRVKDPENYSTYFININNVKFRNKVVPGDTMVMKMVLTSPVRRGVANIKGFIFVDGKVATEAEMVATIRHKE
ncbi:MAG: bifunctional UDP-3-O-[3-hydroxymyristoyl] N-acetylglucosamine deacetylase/3-hydroxyacyl-ACP dehydratase [Paludibacteraceae bacterium]|nr:bifunctional UDP-3-O-[3-hydroxymyristoyl] N-acetylglucosamine deacetylase/3-hydroxyacyl-ACP dehydratase [Paludibacteraceae bacterium]